MRSTVKIFGFYGIFIIINLIIDVMHKKSIRSVQYAICVEDLPNVYYVSVLIL